MNKINYALMLSMNEINSAAFLGFEKLFTLNSNKKKNAMRVLQNKIDSDYPNRYQ
jgi:hypothetical protein